MKRTIRGIRPRTKIHRLLCHFAAGHSLNTFEAQGIGDSVLAQSVQSLELHGYTFVREPEVHRGFMGAKTYCVRYRLTPEAIEKAKRRLATSAKDDDHGFSANINPIRLLSEAVAQAGGA